MWQSAENHRTNNGTLHGSKSQESDAAKDKEQNIAARADSTCVTATYSRNVLTIRKKHQGAPSKMSSFGAEEQNARPRLEEESVLLLLSSVHVHLFDPRSTSYSRASG